MAELLLELFSEEIPARMQARAARDLERLVGEALGQAGLAFDKAEAFATPRRLALVMTGLPEASPPTREERRGPRVGAPDKALQGFMRAAGLKSIDDATIVSDSKKGDYYLAVIEKPGRRAGEILADIVPDIVRRFPWPISMRWGAGRLRWVRPLHAILCLLDGEAVPFALDGLESGAETRGHRFMAPEPFRVHDFASYRKELKARKVVLSLDERARIIARSAERIATREGLAIVEDKALLAENAGLTEWPVVLAGRFDADFLAMPAEVLMTAMKAHQKCFSLRDPETGKLANRFLMVANLQTNDRGRAIMAGNERVIRARLSDAKFFWENDRKRSLDDFVPALDGIVFHEKLGTVGERVRRLEVLAKALAPHVNADGHEAARAARLAKADLVCEMVNEFPELQGVMGRYYALEHGEEPAIAEAIAEHYSPRGPSDAIPTAPVSIAAALADKLDLLVCFWAIGETPTGSKDPYALRRAALGVIRIILENAIRLRLFSFTARPFAEAVRAMEHQEIIERILAAEHLSESGFDADEIGEIERQAVEEVLRPEDAEGFTAIYRAKALDLLGFFADRLKVYLRDKGARHDLIDAVFALGGQDDLLMIVRRVEALGRFLASEDGANLLIGTRRAANILRIEEKRDKRSYDGAPDAALFAEAREKALDKAIASVSKSVEKALAKEDFEAAMAAMAKLRAPVDAFFDHVTVNAEDAALRENRLKLLSRIRAATRKVADFSHIEG